MPDGGVILPGYNHDKPPAVVDGGVTLPGYNHDELPAVVDSSLYVGWDGVSHHEVSLVYAQFKPELAPLQVLDQFPLDEPSVVVAAVKP